MARKGTREQMPSVEGRLAYLEGRNEDHTRAAGELRGDIRELRGEVRDLREQMDRRFEALDQKVDRSFQVLDSKVSRHFTWLVGIQVAVLVAVVSALAGR
jgi:predicted  nucleic acid-binding Zn-ribbon protein